MGRLFKISINSNVLKIIAIITMIIDHIGFYFINKIGENEYLLFRKIGRIAMPIFVYLLVQGFYHTKNFKKYILRVGIFAIVTQLLVTGIMVINKLYFPEYVAATRVYTKGNILFGFVLCLLMMKILNEDIIIKKWDYAKNMSLKIIAVVLIYIIGALVPIDYGVETIFLCTLFYFIERLKIELCENKIELKVDDNIKISHDNLNETKIYIIYFVLIFLSLIATEKVFNYYYTFLISAIFIALYNGNKGKCNNFVKYLYYIIFPLHHILLYLLAMLT